MGPNGEELETAAIVTTKANRTLASIHDRMPVVVPPEAFYLPWRQNAFADLRLALAVRSSRGAAVITELRRTVAAVDGDLALQSLQAMPAMLADSPAVFGRRYPVWLLGVFASCATLLAAIGLFGVLSYVVGERTHELGIRIALGARPRTVILDVARRALPAVLGGLVVGVLGSALVGGALRGLLFESRGFELAVLLPVLAAMLVTALLALLVPARRAATVDPSVALRAE
jgi:putative ABC transport system permease protein